MKVRWDLLSSQKVLDCVERLIRGEVVSQVLNNCGLARVTNIIYEIRKVIGYESIKNVSIGVGKNQGYKIANDEVKQRLSELRDEIVKRIEAKRASKSIR